MRSANAVRDDDQLGYLVNQDDPSEPHHPE